MCGIGLTLVDCDLALGPSQDIGPFLSGVVLAHVDFLHSLFLSIANDGDTSVVLFVTLSQPSDTVGYAERVQLIILTGITLHSRWSQ